MESKFKSQFKTGLGTSEDATERRATDKRDNVRSQRLDKLNKRRTAAGHATSFSIPDLIRALPYNQFMMDNHPLEALRAVEHILGLGDAVDPYYEACPQLYPEHLGGPFLFADLRVLQRIVQLATHPDPEVVRLALRCMVNVAAHAKSGHWVPRLVEAGVLPVLAGLLLRTAGGREAASSSAPSHPPFGSLSQAASRPATVNHRELVIWVLTNMCMDNPTTRDAILNLNLLILPLDDDPDDWERVADYMRALFLVGCPPSRIGPLLDAMVHRILPMAEGRTLLYIITSIRTCVSTEPSYCAALLNDTQLLQRVYRMCTDTTVEDLVQFECARTVEQLTDTEPLLSVQMGVIPILIQLIQAAHNAALRVCGADGLVNLSISPDCLDAVCTHQVLRAISAQFDYTDVFEVRRKLYRTLCRIVLSSKRLRRKVPVTPFTERLNEALSMTADMDLVALSIDGLSYLVDLWGTEAVERMGDRSKLEELASNCPKLEVQELADALSNRIDGMEDREMME